MKTTKTAIYARTSKEDKRTQKVSIDQQVSDAKSYIQQQGWTVSDDHIFVDADRPSRLPPRQYGQAKHYREGLSRLLAAVERGEIDTVVLRKRDRLARSLEMAIWVLRFFEKYNCNLIALHEPSFGEGASGKFATTMMLAVAEYELGRMTENVKAARAHVKRTGGLLCQVRTYGYRHAGHQRVEVDEEAKQIVNEIFSKTVAGESMATICRWLDSNAKTNIGGTNPSGTRAKRWHLHSIQRMLRDVRYIGLDRETGEPSPMYPAIVDPQLFHNVQKILDARRGTRGKSEKKSRNILGGLLKCHYCGESLTLWRDYKTENRKGDPSLYDFWHCANRTVAHERKPKMISHYEWLRFVVNFCTAHPILINPPSDASQLLILTQLDKAKSELDAMTDLLANGTVSAVSYAAGTHALETKIKTLEAKLASLPQPEPANQKLGKFDNCKTDDERRVFLAKHLKFIDVYDNHIEVHDPHGKLISYPVLHEIRPDAIQRRPSTVLWSYGTDQQVEDQHTRVMTGLVEHLLRLAGQQPKK